MLEQDVTKTKGRQRQQQQRQQQAGGTAYLAKVKRKSANLAEQQLHLRRVRTGTRCTCLLGSTYIHVG